MAVSYQFLIYRTADEDVSVNAVIKDETVWLTQNAMAELFSVDKSSISRHLKNIFAEGELNEEVVVAKIATTTQHGAIAGKTQTRETKYYNLDAIISVGYRVNSKRATHFRIWATGVLREYMIKGFALDEKQIRQLERTVTGYFDYIEDLIERENTFTMEEFAASINEFLAFRRYDILPDKGRISGQRAKTKAEEEYAAFNKTQKITSDFDREVRRMLERGGKQEE